MDPGRGQAQQHRPPRNASEQGSGVLALIPDSSVGKRLNARARQRQRRPSPSRKPGTRQIRAQLGSGGQSSLGVGAASVEGEFAPEDAPEPFESLGGGELGSIVPHQGSVRSLTFPPSKSGGGRVVQALYRAKAFEEVASCAEPAVNLDNVMTLSVDDFLASSGEYADKLVPASALDRSDRLLFISMSHPRWQESLPQSGGGGGVPRRQAAAVAAEGACSKACYALVETFLKQDRPKQFTHVWLESACVSEGRGGEDTSALEEIMLQLPAALFRCDAILLVPPVVSMERLGQQPDTTAQPMRLTDVRDMLTRAWVQVEAAVGLMIETEVVFALQARQEVAFLSLWSASRRFGSKVGEAVRYAAEEMGVWEEVQDHWSDLGDPVSLTRRVIDAFQCESYKQDLWLWREMQHMNISDQGWAYWSHFKDVYEALGDCHYPDDKIEALNLLVFATAYHQGKLRRRQEDVRDLLEDALGAAGGGVQATATTGSDKRPSPKISLDLSMKFLTAADVKTITQIFKAQGLGGERLGFLNLEGNAAGSITPSLLLQWDFCTGLNLSLNHVNDGGVSILSKALMVSAQRLTHLDLSWNVIGPEGLAALAAAIDGGGSKDSSHVTCLILNGNAVTNHGQEISGLKALCSAIGSPFSQITTLSLGYASLSEKDVVPIAEMLMEDCTKLQTLVLAGNTHIGIPGLETLSASLSLNNSLELLDLSNIDAADSGKDSCAVWNLAHSLCEGGTCVDSVTNRSRKSHQQQRSGKCRSLQRILLYGNRLRASVFKGIEQMLADKTPPVSVEAEWNFKEDQSIMDDPDDEHGTGLVGAEDDFEFTFTNSSSSDSTLYKGSPAPSIVSYAASMDAGDEAAALSDLTLHHLKEELRRLSLAGRAGRGKGKWRRLDVALVYERIGESFHIAGSLDEALSYFLQALDIRIELLGPDHMFTASSWDHLGALYWAQEDLVKAEDMFKRSLHVCDKVLGDSHALYSTALTNLGLLYMEQRRFEEAEPLFFDALWVDTECYGDGHIETVTALTNLAALCYAMGDKLHSPEGVAFEDTESMLREALRILDEKADDKVELKASTEFNLGSVLRDKGRLEEAETLYRQSLEGRRSIKPQHSPDLETSLVTLATILIERVAPQQLALLRKTHIVKEREAEKEGLYAVVASKHATEMRAFLNKIKEQKGPALLEAKDLFREAVVIREREFGEDSPEVAELLFSLAHAHFRMGEFKEGEPLFRQAMNIKDCRRDGAEYARCLLTLGVVYNQQDKFKMAQEALVEAVPLLLGHFGNGSRLLERAKDELTRCKAKVTTTKPKASGPGCISLLKWGGSSSNNSSNTFSKKKRPSAMVFRNQQD